MLKSSLCDYSDAYILVWWIITVPAANNCNKKVILKTVPLFTDCISEINNSQVNKDTDVVMLIYNLIEYSNNYLKISESLW